MVEREIKSESASFFSLIRNRIKEKKLTTAQVLFKFDSHYLSHNFSRTDRKHCFETYVRKTVKDGITRFVLFSFSLINTTLKLKQQLFNSLKNDIKAIRQLCIFSFS